MIADGTNDAPALLKADAGFCYETKGTEIAKNASDILVTNESFTPIVNAFLWGRNVFEDILSFLKFNLTVNLTVLVTLFLCAAISNELIFSNPQLMWINLIMDVLAAIALATDAPSADLFSRTP